ncbi:hypothetical protein [Sinomonas atrocyanea]
MFEYFSEAHELFVYRLGIARGTSRRSIVTLGVLEQESQRREVAALMLDLSEEARLHAAVLEDCFAELERNVAVPRGTLPTGSTRRHTPSCARRPTASRTSRSCRSPSRCSTARSPCTSR